MQKAIEIAGGCMVIILGVAIVILAIGQRTLIGGMLGVVFVVGGAGVCILAQEIDS